RADHLPTVSTVSCLVNELAADVNLVVIVRRNCERHRPHETILEICSDFAANIFRPHFDVASLSSFQVEDFDDAANAAGTRSARPDDVVVDWIGSSPATLTAGDTNPGAPRNWSAETA